MNVQEFGRCFSGAFEGATVWTRDGEKLGHVLRCEEQALVIERGVFFRKDFSVPYDDVAEVRNAELILSRERDELRGEREHVPPIGAAVEYAEQEKRDAEQGLTDGNYRPRDTDAA